MNRVLSFFFVLCLMLGFGIASAQTTYTKVTGADQLVIGGKYIIVAESAIDEGYAMGGQKTNNRAANSLVNAFNGNTVSVTEATQNSTDNVANQAVAFVLGAATGNAEYYTFYDAINNGYLYAASSTANQLKTQTTNNENGEWNITFNGNACSIVASGSSNRNVMQFNLNSSNNGSPLFSCYASASQTAVSLFVDASSLSDDPAMVVTAPANNAFFFANSVNVNLTVRNFALGTDGKVKYMLDENAAQYSTEATFTISGIEDGEHTLALELVDMDEESLETPVTANVTFTTDADYSTLLTIPAIQGTEEENAQNGNVVATQGVVTAKTQYGFYIQSSTDAYSGLYIYSPDHVADVEMGDMVVVRGTMSEYNGLTEMGDVTDVIVISSDNELFEPIELFITGSEQYESMLVKVSGTHNGTMLSTAWQLQNDAEETIYIGADCFAFTPAEGIDYEVTGVLSYTNKSTYNVGWVILPRSAADITENVDGIALRVLSPAEGSTVMADNVEVQFRVYNFVLGTDGKLKYTLNNGEAQYITSEEPFTVENLANGSNTLAFELVTMENASLETPVTATVTFEARTNGQLSIRDIQYTTAADGASPYDGQTVTISGTVTALNSDKFYIQDAEAAWSGLYIYNTNSDRTPARNDNVTVTGTITEYNGLTEMNNPTAVVNNGAATPVNGLALASISEIAEPYESVLVTVTGTCTNIGGAKKWTISDGTSIIVFGLTYTPTVGTSYTVTGIVDWFGQDGIWELKPRDENDIVVGGTVPTISITNPANGSTIYSAAVNATVEVFNFTVGTDGNISFSIDDGEAVSETETSHAFTGLTNGEHTIHASLVATDQSIVASAASTFTVNLAGPTFTAIRDIQYTTEESGDSPLNNQTVWVKGVVTSNFTNTPYFPVKGYSIQDANEAWSGVWVFDSINNPNIGDSVKFQATVTEYYGLTELKNVTNYEFFNIGVASPIDVTVNESKSEAYEGCYVRVECVRSVGHTMPYGNWKCVNEAGDTVSFSHNFANDAYTIEDNKYYRVAGVVEYSYGAYYVNYPSVNDIVANCNLAVDEISENSIEVYPNPTNGMINIANAEGKSIVVINTLGQVVAHIDNAAENQTIDMSGLCDGTYFVKVDGNVVKVNMIR
ncbi:MAG: T9SS type A sorting domain-containing protein [Bacteroidales bacterium]|nr:T9SS type A sorting domain-containing protein [Bacteroidales bacterium]